MVYSETTQIKIRTLILAYLSLKSEPSSGEEICDWINNNNFGLNKVIVNEQTIYLLIREGYASGNVLRQVKIIGIPEKDNIFYTLREVTV